MKDWIPIFKAGTHTDSQGRTETWDEARLDRVVSLYNPEHHEAPLVIGHPKDNAPAYGWAEKIKRVGETLFAKPRQVAAEFASMVNEGWFKKRSVSFYPDGSLRHIGFLGAVPPAVKGLPDFAFADDGAVTIEFEEFMDDYQLDTVRRLFRRIREFIIEKFGVDTADQVVASYDIDTLEPIKSETGGPYGYQEDKPASASTGKEEKTMKLLDWLKGKAKQEGVEIEDASFGEPSPPPPAPPEDQKAKEFAEAQKQKEEDLKAREAALDQKEKTFSEKEVQARKDEVKSFLEGLAKEGKVTPAMMKLGLADFLEQVSGMEAEIEFSEGEEGKEEKKTHAPVEVMKKLLSGLPRQIEFGEAAGADKGAPAGSNAGEKLEAIIQQKMKENDKLEYQQAFSEAMKENPGLAQEYAESIGPAH